MNIIRQEIRTGVLVVVSLAILVTVLLYLGAPGVFVPMKTFYIYVDNAAGLAQGAEVTLAGRRVGEVVKLNSPVPEASRPDPKKETMIEVRVNKTAKIYKRVTVSLTSFGLLKESLIDFSDGIEASGLAPDKTSFVGVKPPGLDQAVPMVLEKLDPALKKATETLDSLQQTANNLSKLTDPNGEITLMVAEFRKTGVNLNDITAKEGPLRETLENISDLTGPDGKIQKAIGNIEELTASGGSLTHALVNAEKFTGDLANNKDIRLTLENSRRATAELDTTLNELRFKFGTIADNLSQASDTVKHQPWRLIWPTTKKYPDSGKPSASPAPKRRLRGDTAPLP